MSSRQARKNTRIRRQREKEVREREATLLALSNIGKPKRLPWSDVNSDPLGDIREYIKQIESAYKLTHSVHDSRVYKA